MIRTAEAEGKDIFAAAAVARQQLGISEDEGSMEVLITPRSGFLGIGSRPARVRVTVEIEDAPVVAPRKQSEKKSAPEKKSVQEKKPTPEKKSTPEKKNVQEKKPAVEKKVVSEKKAAPVEKPTAEKKSAPEKKAVAPVNTEERKAQVQEFLKGLLSHMDIEADVIVTDREGGGLDVELAGPNMGAVIGRRGETLDAIQHLTNYALNRGGEKHMHISVDAESYRAKREDSLVRLAEKMAAKALKYNRSMALEPMNSYERHVIHTALQNYEGVSTASTGTEPNRRVVVSVVRPAGEKSEKSAGRSRGNRPPRAPREKKEETVAPVSEEKPVTEEAPVVVEKPAPVMPEGYEPPQKNKPTTREWC